MALHNSLEGFMGELKALPKGSADRGRFITAHMSHPPFIAAVQKHPEGKKIHSQLMGFLNSTANAGMTGARVTMKSELTKASDEVKSNYQLPPEQTEKPTTSEGLAAPYNGDWNNFAGSQTLQNKHFVHNDRHLNKIQAAQSPDGKVALQYIPHTDDTYASDENEFQEMFPGKTFIPYEPPTKLGSVNNFAEARQVGDALIQHLTGGGHQSEFQHPLLQAQSMPGRLGSSVEAVGKPQLPQKLMNSETPATILKTEGDTSVAEKEYSIDEAAAILRKDFHEKLVKYSAEIENLVKRENLSKSVIPSHKHNQAAAASSGTEDIAAGQANPKGVVKSDEKAAKLPNCPRCGGKAAVANVPENLACTRCRRDFPKSGNLSDTMVDEDGKHVVGKSESCAKCGEMHEKMKKCGEVKMGKADLVDAKGNRKDSSEDPQSVDMPDTNPSEPAKRADSSGGKTTKGPKSLAKAARKMNKSAGEMFNKPAYVGKAQPPMAKPPSGGAPGASKTPPMSKPAAPPKMPGAPALGKGAEKLDKVGMGLSAHGQREAASMGFGAKPAAPAAPKPLPPAADQAARGSDLHSQMADVASANAPKPAAAKPTLPKPSAGAKLGLASPKAAGATNAGPVQNAARPVAAKPGIFGKLFGKKQA